MNDPTKDLVEFIESIPFGGINFRVEKENRKVIKIYTTSEETLKYYDNDEAMRDLKNLVDKLIAIGYTGEAHVKLEMKDGNIQILRIFDKKETHYK